MANSEPTILISTGLYPPDIGGPASYSRLLEEELPKHGIRVRILSFGEVRSFPKIIRHIIFFFKVLWRSRGCALVYAQDPVSVGFPTYLATRLVHKPFYLKIVGDYAWEQGVQRFGVTDLLDEFSVQKKYPLPVRVMKHIQTIVEGGAKKLIVPSNYLKRIVMNWGVRGENISVIYNAFEPLEALPSRGELRNKFGFTGKVITSVGRLVPWKGFEGLITVFAELYKEDPTLRLVIIGEGPDRHMLERYAQTLDVKNAILFTGRLAQRDMHEYVKAADVFALNTSYEGFSHQLIEVLAIGTPCVTTSVGGNTEIIRDGENGLLVSYNDLVKLKESISRVLNDEIVATKIVAGGQDTVHSYSNERMISELMRVLELK